MPDEFHIHNLTDPDKAIIFGLAWKPLLGDEIGKKSKKFAISAKASHFVGADMSSACVGIIRIPQSQKTRLRKDVASAAALFARENKQGVSLACVPLPHVEGEEPLFWIIGSQDGVVISGTDKVYDQLEARGRYAELQSRFKLHVEDSGFSFDKPGLQWAGSRLQECLTPLQALPLWAKVGFSLFIAGTISHLGYGYWNEYANQQKIQNRVEFHVDAPKVWNEHLAKWAQQQPVDGPEGLKDLYQKVSDFPVRIGNWLLSDIDCTAGLPGWSCHLSFVKASGGTNETFARAIPASWSVGWDGLGKAIATVSLPSTKQSLSLPRVSSSKALGIGYFAQLQAVLPAFQQVKVSTEADIAIANPTVVDNQGKVLSVNYPLGDAQAPLRPKKQSLSFYGPLRSLSVLPVDPMTHFSRLQVQVNQDVVTDASLGKSMLMATLQGDLYVF